jgi:hypothetical protein
VRGEAFNMIRLFPERLSALEIEHFFTLDEDELASVRERRGLRLVLR